jgi:hypothetical protein
VNGSRGSFNEKVVEAQAVGADAALIIGFIYELARVPRSLFDVMKRAVGNFGMANTD